MQTRQHIARSWLIVVPCFAMLMLVTTRGEQEPSSSQDQPVVVAEDPAAVQIFESLPPSRAATVKDRDAQVAKSRPRRGFAPMFVLELSKKWTPGSTLTVAFRGGTEAVHARIAQVAAQWSSHANIGFDFGYQPGKGYRTWAPTDTQYAAQIRIGFDEDGYFSCVGNDGVDAVCATTGQSSMNYQGFDRSLPFNWQSVVLHEFGHALGLQHEHQNPQGGCDAEFRWEDDPGYVRTTDAKGQFIKDSMNRRPGIYTTLGGPPNNWTKTQVDSNMRMLPRSNAFQVGVFDKLSIMKYDFEPWMYVSGEQSPCFSGRNDVLSRLDREGIARLYPRLPADVLTKTRERENAIAALRDGDALSAALKQGFQEKIDALKTVR